MDLDLNVLYQMQDERDEQKEKWSAAHDDELSYERWFAKLEHQMTLAKTAAVSGRENEVYDRFIKIGTLTIAALESFRRSGITGEE